MPKTYRRTGRPKKCTAAIRHGTADFLDATDAADLVDAAELGLTTDFVVAADFAVTADFPVLPDFTLVISLTEPPIASNSDSTSASAIASSFFRSLSIS